MLLKKVSRKGRKKKKKQDNIDEYPPAIIQSKKIFTRRRPLLSFAFPLLLFITTLDIVFSTLSSPGPSPFQGRITTHIDL